MPKGRGSVPKRKRCRAKAAEPEVALFALLPSQASSQLRTQCFACEFPPLCARALLTVEGEGLGTCYIALLACARAHSAAPRNHAFAAEALGNPPR